MFETFWKWIVANYPKLAVPVFGIWFASYATKCISDLYHRLTGFDQRLTAIEKSCHKIDEEILPRLDKMDKTLTAILVYLKSEDRDMPLSALRAKIPRKRNEPHGDLMIRTDANYLPGQTDN